MKHFKLFPLFPLLLLLACSPTEDPEEIIPDPNGENPDPSDKEEGDEQPPSIPGNLTISNKSFESLTLSWTPSTDNDRVANYEVFLNENSYQEVGTALLDFSGLIPGQTYSFSVVAIDASGNLSDKSSPIEETMLEDNEPPEVPGGIQISAITTNSISLTWIPSSDNAGILEYEIHLNGEFLTSTTSTEFTISDLEEGRKYTLALLARDIYGNISTLSDSIEATIESTAVPGNEDALFISEYIEGSSFNKAIEIVNLTGAEVDLSSYSLKKISNQNEEWSDEKKLVGKLASGEVYVIAHSSANEAILSEADFTLGGGVVDFNGNDSVGLFKDGELIDRLGVSGGEEYAKDVTLRRKASIQKPNLLYTPEEWDILEKDTVDGLGTY